MPVLERFKPEPWPGEIVGKGLGRPAARELVGAKPIDIDKAVRSAF